VNRYSLFITKSYYDYYGGENPNPEPMADDIIKDTLPTGLKFIVHNMTCPKSGASYVLKNKYVGNKEKTTAEKDEEVYIGTVEIPYDRGTVTISGGPVTENIIAYHRILVVNKTNGKRKEFKAATEKDPYKGHGDISDMMVKGNNTLEFYVISDEDFVQSGDIYVIYEEYSNGISPCGGACTKGYPEYTPPTGYAVNECNTWDRDLKEERPCADYKNDIVVTIIPGNPCACAPNYTNYKKECTNGGVPTDAPDDGHCGSYKCVCSDNTVKTCHISEPIIYLYPEKETDVNVKVAFDGKFTVNVPKYDEDGWNVVSYPNGKIINKEDNKEYRYLYWEADLNNMEFDLSEGFVIEGKETKTFLEGELKEAGMNN